MERRIDGSTTDGEAAFRPQDVCVIIPAFNEEASVGGLITALHSTNPAAHIVVIDDGSSDGTAQQAAGAGAAVVVLPVNLGIGGAVQTGYRYAERLGFPVAVQMDGDGQHLPSELDRLIEPVMSHRADVSIGSRWLGRGSYPSPSGRRFGMRILAGLVAWRAGQRLTDTTSGFRCVGPVALSLFAESYPTDFPEVETLVTLKRRGLRIEEVPVLMQERLHGKSSIAGVKSAYYMVRVILLLLIGQPAFDGEEEPAGPPAQRRHA